MKARRAVLAQNSQPVLPWLIAVRAAEAKKAFNIRVLDLREVSSFTDYFVLCSGANGPQIQAITDEVQEQLSEHGQKASSVEGFRNAEWVLADYGDFIVHVFSEEARKFYDLERLWRDAKDLKIPAA